MWYNAFSREGEFSVIFVCGITHFPVKVSSQLYLVSGITHFPVKVSSQLYLVCGITHLRVSVSRLIIDL